MSQKILPYLLYEDVDAALSWLAEAFGFREELRYTPPGGGPVNHAEMRLGDEAIMLGHPGPDFRSPKRTGTICQFLSIEVDDVDAHYERARAAGAEIDNPPVDKPYGDRSYMANDPEGQRWSFFTPTGDVTPEEWGAERTAAP